MMDFGYLGSSSNLSPLAPPFTLDRTIPRPNNENFVNFTDPPPAVPFSSSIPNWQFSAPLTSNPDFYSNSGADSPPAVPFSPSIPNWEFLPTSGSNPDFYSNYNTNLGVDSTRTTYYPFGAPSISSPSTRTTYHPFGAPSISSPSTQMPPLNSNVSTTPDVFSYPQYSGVISNSQIDSKTYCPSFGSGVVEDNVPLGVLHEPRYDLSSNSHITPVDGSPEVDYHQSLSDLNYKQQWGSYWDRIDRLADGETGKQVGYNGSFRCIQTEDVGSYAYKGSSTAEGFNKNKEASAVPQLTCLNLLGGESNIMTTFTGEPERKPFSTHGSSFTPYDPAKTLGISAFPKRHLNVRPVESATTFLNHRKPYGSQEHSLQQLNTGKTVSVTIKRPSPPLVMQQPSVESNMRLDRKEHLSDPYSSNINGELTYKPMAEDVKEYLSKAGMELQHPDINAPPYGFTSASDRAKSVSSVEGPVESSDRHYPALDSPCWKGVSSFRFSPSEDCGAVTPKNLAKKPESLGDLKLQCTPFFTPFGEDCAKVSNQKVHENNVNQENRYVELGSLLCPDRLPNASSPVKMDNSTHDDGVDHAKMSSSNKNSLFDSIDKLQKELDAPNDLKRSPDLNPSQCKQLDCEKDLELGFGVAEAELNCNNASPKLNIQKLVDTIHNLSEMLLFQCSEDASALVEVGHAALKLAIKNLDACLSKTVRNPAEESNLYKSVISGRTVPTKEASLSFGDQQPQQIAKDSELSETDAKKFADLLLARVDGDFEKDDKVTRALKKVLEENFRAGEAMQSETLMYKNLWLEAEAALCSVSFRARYDRMKTEMDKYKEPKTIVAEPEKCFEKLYNEVFPDPIGIQKGNPVVEAFKMLHKSTQDPSALRKTETADEAETSLRARLHILNNRLPNHNFVIAGKHTDDNDGGGDDLLAGEQTDEDGDAAFAETIKTVEKLLSSVDTEDFAMANLTQKVPSRAIGSMIPSSSETGENVEARVMARLQILKDRGLKAKCEKSGQLLNSVFSGEENPWRFNAVLCEDDMVDGPLSQYCKVSEPEKLKDFNVCASDNLVSLSGGSSKRLGSQLSSGWCDGSLSDWEDVVKDDHCR